MPRAVTLQDVADAVGVSAQTVSRVLNGRPYVADDTRLRVLEMAERMGYRPTNGKANDPSAHQGTLGLVSGPLGHHSRSEVITGAQRQARSLGYLFVHAIHDEDGDDLAKTVGTLMERQVVGLLVVGLRQRTGVSPGRPPTVVPVVSTWFSARTSGVISVHLDNVDGAYQAMRHLLHLGHRRIGIIGGSTQWQSNADRLVGARRALLEEGVAMDESLIYSASDETVDDEANTGYEGAAMLIESHPEVTALFCHGDWMALGAARALQERGLRIPRDISLVGYGDMRFSSLQSPSLSSVRFPHESLGELLAQLLVDAVEHGLTSQREVLVRGEMIPRESSAPPRI